MSAQQVKETAKLTAADRRITGQVFCASGQHYVRAELIAKQGRRPICKDCAARIARAKRA